MKTNVYYAIFAMLAVSTITSCSVYHPQMMDIPLLSHKGDGRVEVSQSLDSYIVIPVSSETNAMVSYAVSDRFAVQVGGSSDLNKSGYGQAAVGFYYPNNHFVTEIYMGGGMGRTDTKSVDDPLQDYVVGNYSIGFVQGNLGWIDLAKGHIDLGLGIKFGALKPSIDEHQITKNGTTVTDYRSHYTDVHSLIEPQAMFRVGGEKLKFTLRVALSWLSYRGVDSQFNYTPFSLSLGANYRF